MANRLTDLLLNTDLKTVSTGALDQFDLDVIQCELFASQCPVAGLEVCTSAVFHDLYDLYVTSNLIYCRMEPFR